jgi:hypothetical protein
LRNAPDAGRETLCVDDLARSTRRVEEPANVGTITSHHVSPETARNVSHDGADHVGRARATKQSSGGVRPLLGQAHDITTVQ